jgi:hypothetical protein
MKKNNISQKIIDIDKIKENVINVDKNNEIKENEKTIYIYIYINENENNEIKEKIIEKKKFEENIKVELVIKHLHGFFLGFKMVTK